ncbi:hypothetical protein BHM03_00003420 [Ensete ventricosum]|nr:hypothetical protein BHM03_00003420 [Ensete ventricosum]
MKLQPDDGLRSTLSIGPGFGRCSGISSEFARRFPEGIGKLAGNMSGDCRKKTIGLAARMPEDAELRRLKERAAVVVDEGCGYNCWNRGEGRGGNNGGNGKQVEDGNWAVVKKMAWAVANRWAAAVTTIVGAREKVEEAAAKATMGGSGGWRRVAMVRPDNNGDAASRGGEEEGVGGNSEGCSRGGRRGQRSGEREQRR